MLWRLQSCFKWTNGERGYPRSPSCKARQTKRAARPLGRSTCPRRKWGWTTSGVNSPVADPMAVAAPHHLHVLLSHRPVAFLLGNRLAGTAQLFGEVLELGEAIFHAQHGRLVVDVHPGCKRKFRDRRRVDVDQAPLRVPRQQMAAADLAPLPIAPLVLVVLADLVLSLGHLDGLGLPESECVDGAGGPAPARGAVAVAGALRIPRDFNRDDAAVALPFEGLFILAHEFSLRSRSRRDI